MRKLVLFGLILSTLACSRDRYELVSTGEQAAYRIDKDTGEVYLIVATVGIPVEFQEKKTPANE